MTRIAHYVASTHWDREWYESFQGYRMRLVSLLDEVFDILASDPQFTTFVMDGQTIPVYDYLEVRPERLDDIKRWVQQGRFKVGPWYVLPDEWLVSGESIVRNLLMGIHMAEDLGESSRAGFVCDQFGHISQLPQIFSQLGIPGAFVWRGTHEREHHGHFNWASPDGTAVPTYRFGPTGYCTYTFRVRHAQIPDEPFDLEEAVDRLVDYARFEAGRSPLSTILLFDGGDHMEIEPRTSTLLAAANEQLAAHDIRIVHSDLDRYLADITEEHDKIPQTLTGELRETGRDPGPDDEHWLIPGVLSSRIHLKQRNAACEDELCLWAEPFSAFASDLDSAHPDGYLRLAWKHLIENHPHDSICGCSIDQVHQDMIYRFDQSLGISSRLTDTALKTIALAAIPRDGQDAALAITVFNATTRAVDEPLDLEIPLPVSWPKTYQEFFGYEEKFSFRLRTADGAEAPYQLVAQERHHNQFRRPRYKFPQSDPRHIVAVTARLAVPALGYTTLLVEEADGPTRYSGTLAPQHDMIENESLRVQVGSNGTLTLTDKRTGKVFEKLLTFEERADIGDGWYHGVAVNDQIFTTLAGSADVALIADGIGKATLRVELTMHVPSSFDFHTMTRSRERTPLRIVSDVTLRSGVDRVEITTTIDNTVLDHRLRVLFPTNLSGDTYLSDGAFDVLERPIALARDNDLRRELDVETRPQQSWTAFGDGTHGLAVVSRGLPECTVRDTADRAIALTLLRGFRRAVLTNDNLGGEILGSHTFRYDVVPFGGTAPIKALFLLGQRINHSARMVSLLPRDWANVPGRASLPGQHSFLGIEGEAVVTSVQRRGDALVVRLFNPHSEAKAVHIRPDQRIRAAEVVRLDETAAAGTATAVRDGAVEVVLAPKRIMTILLKR